jgi:putative transposase
VATTSGNTAEDVKDLMVATVEHRYGQVNRVPEPIEWLTDNGSCYTARDTRSFALATSAWCRLRPRSAAHNRTAWQGHLFAPLNATMSG